MTIALISKKDAAMMLGISTRSLDKLRSQDDRFPSEIRIMGAVRWRVTDIEAYIASL